jgi:hypothetical protein
MIPFSSLNEFVQWDLRNCCDCDRSDVCQYQDALAGWQPGTAIPLPIAKSIGVSKSGGLLQDCQLRTDDHNDIYGG